MFTLPTPLHPVIVHFPIVLVILGAAVAVVSVGLSRWHLPWIAAVLLMLGSIGAFVASQTGEAADKLAGELSPSAETLLEAHEEWGERTEGASAVASVLAFAAAAISAFSLRRKADPNAVAPGGKLPKLALGLRAVAALAALTACYFVYETGHAGGKLVYEHGVGVKLTTAKPGQPATRTRVDRD